MRKALRYAVILTALFVVSGMSVGVAAEDSAKEKPCTSAEYSQFDFWVGKWRVTDEKGEFQGTNSIMKALGGCVLEESWTGAKGMRGKSFNIYAKGRKSWHQTWVDTNGMLLMLDGGLVDGKMVLVGEIPGRDGNEPAKHEISWEKLADGGVRQAWRMSRDGGSTWQQVFVGIYSRSE
jgi:hypothetical protein